MLQYAAGDAFTEVGRTQLAALLDSRNWAQDVATSRLRQAETQEASYLLDRDALWGPLQGLADPSALFERLSKGSVLEVVELALLRKWLYAIDSWSQMPREEIRTEHFRKALTQLPDAHRPIQILERVLTPEDELSERASPKLASLHQEIRSLKREIGNMIDHLVKSFAQRGVLQESFSDVRDGRYVLPIKISSQSEVEGTIYEASASRQTVFIEPKEVAPLNNRLRQRQNELIQEVYRVLTETTAQLKPFGAEVEAGIAILSHWDAVQARARLGRRYSGKAITVTEDRMFILRNTAHPLLWWAMPPEQIIRNQIDFGEPIRSLLLTGPNTGGKTVLLKTLGLAGLCARTGFPFPGTDQPTIPFFHTFFADLGDPQSIEEHLSSFSGHIMRFKEVLENVTAQSLVLIDELNSATDPEEGAALGRAFLETIMARGAMIVTTTHDPHLKAVAVHDDRILNASMQFDESSRAPTYRMVLGVPGRSRALETAERLGIERSVVELARSYLSREHNEFEAMLSRLEHDTLEAARARKEAVALRDEAQRLQKEWTERTEQSVNEMLERTRTKLRRVLEQAQDEVRASVQKLDEIRSRRELDKTRAALNETITTATTSVEKALREEAPEVAQALEKSLEARRQPEEPSAIKLERGIAVRIPKWKNTGTVLEVLGNKVKVAMGTLQMTLAQSEVEPLAQQPKKAVPQTRISGVSAYDSGPGSSLDIRGKRFDDAMSELEAYLDLAYRAGAVEVTVVHGLGTGALREGTRKLLGSLPYVKTFRDGGAGHGGTGATLIEFDRD